MSVDDVRTSISSPAIPRPRTGGHAPVAPSEPSRTPDAEVPQETAPDPLAARYPWPEPWRSAGGARPRTEYWDVATASWRSRGPLPRPAPGD
jgi:hypothetical protein